MAAFSGFLAVGGAVVDGVLTELPGVPRRPVAGDLTGGFLALSAGVTFGPFAAAVGVLNAAALFSAATGGTPLHTTTLLAITAAANQFLTLPAGAYAMTTGAPAGANVLTFNGEPIAIGGQPLQVG